MTNLLKFSLLNIWKLPDRILGASATVFADPFEPYSNPLLELAPWVACLSVTTALSSVCTSSCPGLDSVLHHSNSPLTDICSFLALLPMQSARKTLHSNPELIIECLNEVYIMGLRCEGRPIDALVTGPRAGSPWRIHGVRCDRKEVVLAPGMPVFIVSQKPGSFPAQGNGTLCSCSQSTHPLHFLRQLLLIFQS